MKSKLCENLKALRRLRRYSFKDLEKLMADRGCKVAASTIYRYEVGKIPNVPYESIIALADIYRVTPAFLMGWADGPVLNALEQDLVSDFRKLNAQGQTVAVAAVKGLTQIDAYVDKKEEAASV